MTQTHCPKPDNHVRVVRATVIGVSAGYAVLLGLLLIFHEAPKAVLDDLVPFLIVGGVGLAFSIGPVLFPDVQNRFAISGRGLGKSCASQALAPQQVLGLMAMGMMFGALLSQTVKLFFG